MSSATQNFHSPSVFNLLKTENVSVEEFLKFLVRKIYAKLFKSVDLKVLKSEDIENSNEVKIIGTFDPMIDLRNHPTK